MAGSRTVYDVVTDRIVKLLEAGTVPWRRAWAGAAPGNIVTGKEYRGINAMLLGSVGHGSPWFLTFKQARDLGGCVKKGEHGYPVIYWIRLDDEEDPGEEKDGKARKGRGFLRYSTVFNLEQTEGVRVPKGRPLGGVAREPVPAEDIIASYKDGPMIRHGGDSAHYTSPTDTITMPPRETFLSEALYWRTLYHEATHSTAHKDRLNRPIGALATAGKDAYGKEELIAEMGAAMLCAVAGLPSDGDETDSAPYIAGWLRSLREPGSSKLVVEAASAAQKAADWILGKRPGVATSDVLESYATAIEAVD